MRRRPAGVTLAMVLLLCGVVGVSPALAAFNTATTASASYTSSTLQQPGSASGTCAAAGSTATATVTWTASPSTYATGYRITSTPATVTQTAAKTATSVTFTGLTKGSSYTFSVVATYLQWTSAARTTSLVAC